MKRKFHRVAGYLLSFRALPSVQRFLRRGSALSVGLAVTAFAQFDQAAQDRADNAARDRIRQLEERARMDPGNKTLDRERISILQERFQQQRWIEDHNLQDLVLLPPIPPCLAETRTDLPALFYPAILADYAGEPFYMAFGQLYFQRLLNPVQIERIEKYRRARDALATELRTKLADKESLNRDKRDRLPDLLAANQHDSLRALEDEAEAIRRDLGSIDRGKALAERRDSETSAQTPGLRDYLASLFAAHYDEGLSVQQRELLHAIAMESLLTASGQPRQEAFFLPATARLKWPALPATASASLDRFNALRKTLRDELMQAVVSESQKKRDSKRPLNHSRLAASQAQQFAELERLAEELRLAAAGLPYPGQPSPPEYPPELIRLVAEAVAAKADFRLTSSRNVVELNREFAPARFRVVVRENKPMIEEIHDTKETGKSVSRSTALSARLSLVNQQLLDEHRELTAKLEDARAAVSRYRETLPGTDAPSVSQLSTAIAQSHEQGKIWRRHADYRAAVLTPGLSPAQRRLLFNAALRDLEKHRLATQD